MTGTSVPIRVVVADDHHMTRSGVKTALSQSSGIEVVGEASDGVEALDAVSRLKPDVLVLDIEMPRMSGVEVARRLKKADSPVAILRQRLRRSRLRLRAARLWSKWLPDEGRS